MPVDNRNEAKTAQQTSLGRPTRRWLGRLVRFALVLVGLLALFRIGASVRSVLKPSRVNVATKQAVTRHVTLRHAKRFFVEYRTIDRLVHVTSSSKTGSNDTVYQLVSRGHLPPTPEPGAIVIETPVRRAIALSTTFVTSFVQLGLPDALVGMTGTRQLNTPELVERVKQNRLVEVGDGTLSMSKVLDLERIRLLAPDLIFSSYLGDESGKLREAGFSVVENLQWLESTPLARAEWLKFMALFLNREVEAERLFSSIEERYERAKSRAIAVSRQPTVMCGSDYRGTWFVPGGRTYVAKFIEDAGGNYLWKDDSSLESIPLKMEAVLSRAKNADIWLLHMSSIRSRKELGELEPRNALFSAFKTGEVYNNDAILSAGGGNDYWENGVNNPDLVLLDLIAVLHPDLVPDYRSRWYRKLPEGTLH